MTWKLVGREYHSGDYRLTPETRGWSCWYDGTEPKRIGMGIELLTDAKKLAEKHKQGAANE